MSIETNSSKEFSDFLNNITVRSRNVIKAANLDSFVELTKLTAAQFSKLPSGGSKSAMEVMSELETFGLGFSVDATPCSLLSTHTYTNLRKMNQPMVPFNRLRNKIELFWPTVEMIFNGQSAEQAAQFLAVSSQIVRRRIQTCLLTVATVNSTHQKGVTDLQSFKVIGTSPKSVFDNADWWKETKAIYDKHWQKYDEIETEYHRQWAISHQ